MGLKYNLYTPKCTYEHLKLEKIFGSDTPDPPCGRGTPPPAPSPARPLAMLGSLRDRSSVRQIVPHVPKRSDGPNGLY